MSRIYLDYNASTPIAPEVRSAMAVFLDDAYGNPGSRHWAADPAREAIDTARKQVADLIGASAGEIVFTSGGSESNNAAIKGVLMRSAWTEPPHVVTTRVEHPAVTEPCRYLERLGGVVTYVGVDRFGRVDPSDVASAIRPNTRLVSVMLANNEVGTIEPVAEIGEMLRGRSVVFHSDAAQAVGKIPVDVRELGVDLLTVVGHKMYGPKGVGALYVRSGVELEPLIHGGGQEGRRRAGTENALLAVGLGAACALAAARIPYDHLRALRDDFWDALSEAFGDGVVLNGHPTERLPNTLSVSFAGRNAEQILSQLDGVAASTGAACHTGRVELSSVLDAMGVAPDVGMGTIRFSLGEGTTHDDVKRVVAMLVRVVG